MKSKIIETAVNLIMPPSQSRFGNTKTDWKKSSQYSFIEDGCKELAQWIQQN